MTSWKRKRTRDDFRTTQIENIKRQSLKYASGGAKKPILQYTEDGEFIREWDSLKAATEYYKVSKGCLSAALSNKRKMAIGFIWRYK